MKKFENLGKKISKNEQKNIKGGLLDDGGGQCGTACADTTACTTSGGHSGHCHMPTSGSNAGKCFCVAVY